MEFHNSTARMILDEAYWAWCEDVPYDWDTYISILFIFTVILLVIALWGIIVNVINLIVFSRIGILSDSSTVSLFGLAISDLIYCIAQFWTKFWAMFSLFYIYYIGEMLVFVVADLLSPLLLIFNQVTCFLTTYIALERFVAIVFPFKVKYIFTSMKTLYAVCFCFVWNIGLHFDETYALFKYKIPNSGNFTDDFVEASGIMRTMNICIRITMFIILVICNATMIRTLSNRKFRKSASSSKKMTPSTITDDSTITDPKPTTINTATKLNIRDASKPEIVKTKITVDSDKRLVTMMAAICGMFVVCNLPHLVNVAVFYIIYSKCHQNYRNTLHLPSNVLELINSSTNIFFYYAMSTRYRQSFLSLFGKQKGNRK